MTANKNDNSNQVTLLAFIISVIVIIVSYILKHYEGS